MKDPEVQAILKDPVFMNLLKKAQENLQDPSVMASFRDPSVNAKLMKL